MKLTTILFDLDGTLLPMDNDEFTRGYFKLLAAKMAPLGYEPKRLVDAVWTGTAAMVKNDGSRSNETAFWQAFGQIYGDRAQADRPIFEAFYENEFQNARAICGFDPAAAQSVRELKRSGFGVALATNPIFPSVATESRIRWAGLEPEEFALYTTYENTAYCKPNPAYYRDVAQRLGVDPGGMPDGRQRRDGGHGRPHARHACVPPDRPHHQPPERAHRPLPPRQLPGADGVHR